MEFFFYIVDLMRCCKVNESKFELVGVVVVVKVNNILVWFIFYIFCYLEVSVCNLNIMLIWESFFNFELKRLYILI